jgi:hypothetical protein
LKLFDIGKSFLLRFLLITGDKLLVPVPSDRRVGWTGLVTTWH